MEKRFFVINALMKKCPRCQEGDLFIKPFDISKPVLSIWRKKGMPIKRLSEFIVREESFDIYELFDRIYPKSNR